MNLWDHPSHCSYLEMLAERKSRWIAWRIALDMFWSVCSKTLAVQKISNVEKIVNRVSKKPSLFSNEKSLTLTSHLTSLHRRAVNQACEQRLLLLLLMLLTLALFSSTVNTANLLTPTTLIPGTPLKKLIIRREKQ